MARRILSNDPRIAYQRAWKRAQPKQFKFKFPTSGRVSVFNAAGEKRCAECGLVKPIADFYQKKHRRVNGDISTCPYHRCKQCHKALTVRWRKDNADVWRAYIDQYIRDNAEHRRELKRAWRRRRTTGLRVSDRAQRYRRKSVKAGGYNATLKHIKQAITFTLEQYRIGDKYLDVYSGELIDQPTIDHIVPINDGGGNGADNMCVTSRENNSSKHATSLLLWLVRRRAAA